MNEKRKLETELIHTQNECEEIISQSRAAEALSKKALADTANIEEKLKKEHSVCQHMEKAKKVLESQVRELQNKLDESEQSAIRSSRKEVQLMELKLKELEQDLLSEQNRTSESI